MKMKTNVEKAKEVDDYILIASGLIKEKRGYNALLNLLQTGILMNDRLGVNDSVVLCKILNHIKFEYDFIPDGIQLKQNSKLIFYNTIMYPPKPEIKTELTSNQSKRDRRLSVGKEEVSTNGWIRTRDNS